MKFTTAIAMSGLLAATAQACTRVLVQQVWQNEKDNTRLITLWDNDMQDDKGLFLPPGMNPPKDEGLWSNGQYSVIIDNKNEGGLVGYPNNKSGKLSQQARKEFKNEEGQTAVNYCFWDDKECGNYHCGLP